MDQQIPTPIASDYVELGTLVAIFVIGGPLNLVAYTQLAEKPISSRLDILKRHLNYSDLLVLFIYVPSRACWLLTYDWRGGDFLCKLVKFLHTFAFQISSNVIVCIALDRLLSVISKGHHSPQKALRRTRIMLAVAWCAAAMMSMPQFLIWKCWLAIEHLKWSQCVTKWEIMRLSSSNRTFHETILPAEQIYLFTHLIMVFWIPAAIVLLCYLIVSVWVYINSRPTAHLCGRVLFGNPVSYRSGVETIDTMLLTGGTRASSITKSEHGNPKIIVTDDSVPSMESKLINRISVGSIDIHRTSVYGNSQSYNARITRSRAIRISCLLVTAYIICWLPYNVMSMMTLFMPELTAKEKDEGSVFSKLYFLQGIMVFNSVINPYLYGLFGSLFKSKPRRPEIA